VGIPGGCSSLLKVDLGTWPRRRRRPTVAHPPVDTRERERAHGTGVAAVAHSTPRPERERERERERARGMNVSEEKGARTAGLLGLRLCIQIMLFLEVYPLIHKVFF
jgi:hypothetical protein